MSKKLIYFTPGEIVTLKQHGIVFVPVMIVKNIKKSLVRNESSNTLLGVACYWFTDSGLYQESVFNTKDLIHYNKVTNN